MSGSFLLDTNILIAFFNQEKEVLSGITEHRVYVPSVVVGELRYGAENSSRKQSNHEQIDKLFNHLTVLSITQATAVHYGKVKSQLKADGSPIPENDIWIAVFALEYELTLVTRDKHFNKVNKLKLITW